ncbi:MAG: hypothetical protein H0Z37_03610 [Firmicutes bacterium]|nr:hypothetical protein [Bacillota bacterium]
MSTATLLQIKDLITVWLMAGNGLFGLWALGLYAFRQPPSVTFARVLLALQLLVGVQFLLGIALLVSGHSTNPGHLMYGILNGMLAAGRVLWHARLVGAGRPGMLWHALLAALAFGLAGRSWVTARY